MAMSSSGLLEGLIPSLLVDAAMERDERQFVFLYGDAPILLVRIPLGDDELQQGLSELEARGGALPFRTEIESIPSRRPTSTGSGRADDGAELAKRMRGHQHFAFAVRKRESRNALEGPHLGRTSAQQGPGAAASQRLEVRMLGSRSPEMAPSM